MIINIIYIIFSYLLGNLLGGKLAYFFYKEDLSKLGSKNIGARNAGRVLGAKAFLFVATVDFFKGFIVISLLKIFNASSLVIAIALFFVILGHIKPILFSFKGGKGVATFIGAMLALSPNLIFVLLLGILLMGFLLNSTTIAFYSSLPALAFIYYMETKSLLPFIVFLFTLILLCFVARKDIEKAFNRYFLPKRRKIVKSSSIK